MARRLLSFLVLLFFVLLGAVPAAELGLRGWERLVWRQRCVKCESGQTILGVRLNQRLWRMFLGAGARDLRVLPGNESTAELLPPNGSWSAVDFLLPEEQREASRFTVTSDSFGFRGPEQKPGPKTYKVLVLGSYQAFGHGVGDAQAYPARLRALLAKSPVLAGRGVVVWNGGMQSASLERGARVLERLLETLRPDLVILDYGMTDQVSRGSNPWLQPFGALLGTESPLFRRLDQWSIQHSTGALGHLYLFTTLVNRAMERRFPENRAEWEKLARSTLARLERSGTRVLLLDQPVAGMPAEVYTQLATKFPRADFLSVREALRYAGLEPRLRAAEDPAWLREFPAEFRAFYREKEPLVPFLGSILHINAEGHEVVAREIVKWVEKQGLGP